MPNNNYFYCCKEAFFFDDKSEASTKDAFSRAMSWQKESGGKRRPTVYVRPKFRGVWDDHCCVVGEPRLELLQPVVGAS